MRRELEEQLDALAREHQGEAFVQEVRRLAADLPAEERELLGELLLERANAFDYGIARRIDEPRFKWFRRAPKEPR